MSDDRQHDGPNRELLELAAFQVGLKRAEYYYYKPLPYDFDREFPTVECINHYTDDDPMVRSWMPLSDDAQCARMESKEMLDIRWHHDRVEVRGNGCITRWELYKNHGMDRNKARRRASVRVVAAMGAYRDRDRKVSPEILQ